MWYDFKIKKCICIALLAFAAWQSGCSAMAACCIDNDSLPRSATFEADKGTKKTPSFKGKFRNEEFRVYIVIDIDSQSVVVPGQEFLGEMAGYLGAERDSRLWYFTSAEQQSRNKASVCITNDYGSEDLEATLTLRPDGTVVLKQTSGSRIKIVVDRKWLKLPSELVFVPVEKFR